MLTKAKATKAKASKPAQAITANGAETDGVERKRLQRPPAAFTAAQRRRMRALFALRYERPLTANEQEELTHLVNAEWDAAIARADRKIKAAYPELKDVNIDSLSPMEWKELSERVKQQPATASKKQNRKR
jgi:hypothetical protein